MNLIIYNNNLNTKNTMNLINKIINKIYTIKWVKSNNPNEKSIKVYPVEQEYPEIFNWVDKGGYKPEDSQYKFSKGLRGRECFLVNVIDRMDPWCVENKHTKLLAKSIYTTDDGREFVEEGISTYGVMDRLQHIIGAYGSWEAYDICIIRSSSMNNPYTILNCNTALAEIPKDYQKYVSKTPYLTDEELTYERYDLNSSESIFRPTSYTKIYNRFQQWIKKIDAALETDFYEQLLAGVEREKKERTRGAYVEKKYRIHRNGQRARLGRGRRRRDGRRQGIRPVLPRRRNRAGAYRQGKGRRRLRQAFGSARPLSRSR